MSYKLYYFDIPGKGESIRLLCRYAQLPFEDVRISREQFMAMKEAGELDYGQVPCLAVLDANGVEVKKLFQSAAIMRYLGKVANSSYGLYPSDPLAAAFVDAIIDEEIDMFTGLAVSRYKSRFGFNILEEDPQLVVLVTEKLNEVVLPKHLSFFEKMLERSTSGWLANTPNPSIADFILVPRLQWLQTLDGISPEILSNYPLLTAFITKFLNLPEIQEYYRK